MGCETAAQAIIRGIGAFYPDRTSKVVICQIFDEYVTEDKFVQMLQGL
jgi:hypothetical protein